MGRLGGCVNTGSARSRLVSWVVGVSVISMLFATGATACVASPAPAPPQPPDCTDPVCPLAAAARSRGIRVGAAVVGRYQGRVDRWDVVNELFEYPVGVQAPSAFDRLGPDYVAELFQAAHAADPGAELWLNEVFTEVFPAKGDALVALVSSLRDRGVPIHGVGLQTHLTLSPAAPNPGSVSGLVARLRALGVEVAITELDVPLGPLRTEQQQVDIYRQVTAECLSAGCTEVTVWGVGDAFTTLDTAGQRQNNPLLAAFFSLPSTPLLLDVNLRPKAAYAAVVAALQSTPTPG